MLIHLLITLLVYALIFGLIWYVITLIPMPPPWLNVVRIVFAIITVIILISLILPLAGVGVGCTSRLIC